MDEGGDVMVSSEDSVTSPDRTDYVTPVHLEEIPAKYDVSSESKSSDVPEYATITSRIRQHDPPAYINHRDDSESNRKTFTEDDIKDHEPEDDIGLSRSRDEEDKIEVLDSLLEEDPKKHGSNGCPPGAVGWAVGITGSSLGGSAKSDREDSNSTTAERNAKILEQFEDKAREKDECLIDCIYYTTTCCECTIL